MQLLQSLSVDIKSDDSPASARKEFTCLESKTTRPSRDDGSFILSLLIEEIAVSPALVESAPEIESSKRLRSRGQEARGEGQRAEIFYHDARSAAW